MKFKAKVARLDTGAFDAWCERAIEYALRTGDTSAIVDALDVAESETRRAERPSRHDEVR